MLVLSCFIEAARTSLLNKTVNLLNIFDEFTYTHYFKNHSSIINLTFTTSAMLTFVKNQQIDEEMTTDSDYKVIYFIISINEAEMIKSSLNSSYNTVKADWTKFAKELQQKSEKILNLIKNSENSLKDLKKYSYFFQKSDCEHCKSIYCKEKTLYKN